MLTKRCYSFWFQKRKGERGSALFLGLAITMGLIVLGSSFLSGVYGNFRLTARSNSISNAENLAEAGAEEAIWEIAHSGADFTAAEGWSGTNPYVKTASLATNTGTIIGEYSVSVTTGATSAQIVSTGFYPSQANPVLQREVSLTYSKELIFKDGMVGYGGVKVANWVLVDSFDSDIGPYGGANIGHEGDLVTNATGAGAVDISNWSTIDGDIKIGPTGNVATDISLDATATVTGTQSTNTEELNSPSTVVPSGLPPRGALVVPNHTNYTISADGDYDSIKVGDHARLIFDADADIYIDGDFEVKSHSTVEIHNSAYVNIFANDEIKLDSHTQIINSSQDPKRLTIYGTDNCTKFELSGHSPFYGSIYMPKADVKIKSQSDLFGGLVGKKIDLDAQSTVHFDISLKTSTNAPFFQSYDVMDWQVK